MSPIAKARRAQAAALRAQADALEAEADALEEGASPDAWITIRESGLPSKTVRHLLRTGVLEGRRVGREWRLSRASLARYMREGSMSSEPANDGPDPLAVELGLVSPRGAA